jgi:hypothetical protein
VALFIRATLEDAEAVARKLKSGDKLAFDSGLRFGPLYRCAVPGGSIMAKRKKASKVQKRAKPPRGNSAKRGKAKAAKAAKATKRTVVRANPKHSAVKKAARKVKQPIPPVVETVAVEVIEQPAPGVITVTEVEERRAS